MFEDNLSWNQLDLAKKSLFIKNITARKISGDNSINLANLPLMWLLYGKEFAEGGKLYSPGGDLEEDNFKSELDWSPNSWFSLRTKKPDGTLYSEDEAIRLASHVQEYNLIEREAKQNGTWLKMPDNSMWEGDPRSWVMMQSKAYKNNYSQTPWYTGQALWEANYNTTDGIAANKELRAPYYLGLMWFSDNRDYANAFANYYDQSAKQLLADPEFPEYKDPNRPTGKVFLAAIPNEGNYRKLVSPEVNTHDYWTRLPYVLDNNNIKRLDNQEIKIGVDKDGLQNANLRKDNSKLLTDDVANWSKDLNDDGIFIYLVNDGPVITKEGEIISPVINEFISQPKFTNKIKFIEGNTGDFDINNPYKYAQNNYNQDIGINYAALGGNLLSGEKTKSLDLGNPKKELNWPAIKSVPHHIVADPNWNSNIETFTPNLVLKLWPDEDVTKGYYGNNPFPYENTIMYNPNDKSVNEDVISLDALHFMHDNPAYEDLYLEVEGEIKKEPLILREALYNQTRNRWITNDILNKIKNNQSLSSDDLEFLRPAIDGFLRQQLSPDYMNYRVYRGGYDDKIKGPLYGPLLNAVDNIKQFMEDKVMPEVEVTASTPQKALGGNLLGFGDWLTGKIGKIITPLLDRVKKYQESRKNWYTDVNIAKDNKDKEYEKEHPLISHGYDVGKTLGRILAIKELEEEVNDIDYNLDRSEEGLFYNKLYNSGGGKNIIGPNMTYTGAYWYPDKKTEEYSDGIVHATTSYGGNNAVKQRNLLDLYTKRKANGVKYLRDDLYTVGDVHYNGPIYEGKIYPINSNRVYTLPISIKPMLDELIENDRAFHVNLNNIPQDSKRYPILILDNILNGWLKPIRDKNGNYTLRATKLWDLKGTLGDLGALAEKYNNAHGGEPFVLELIIPIKWDDDNTHEYTTDWETIKPTITNTQALGGNLFQDGGDKKVGVKEINEYLKKYKDARPYWTLEDIDYLANKLYSTRWDPRALLHVIATEASFNPRAAAGVSTARGLGQITNDTMKTLYPKEYLTVINQYVNNKRTTKLAIDDAFAYYSWIDKKITQNRDNMGYGRLKVNMLAPNSRLSSNVADIVKKNSLTRDQRKFVDDFEKFHKRKATYLDLMNMYDLEFELGQTPIFKAPIITEIPKEINYPLFVNPTDAVLQYNLKADLIGLQLPILMAMPVGNSGVEALYIERPVDSALNALINHNNYIKAMDENSIQNTASDLYKEGVGFSWLSTDPSSYKARGGNLLGDGTNNLNNPEDEYEEFPLAQLNNNTRQTLFKV